MGSKVLPQVLSLSLSIFIGDGEKIIIFFFGEWQALITIPGHLNQCPTKKLGFSTVLSRRSSPFLNPSLGSISRVLSSSVGPSFTPVVAAMGKRIFVVRAESNSEGDVESAENAEDSEAVAVEESSEVKASAGAEAEGEAKEEAVSESVETKPPWKPRPKLGDIMGVLYLMLFLFCSVFVSSFGC